jgi:hypothetical protein
LISLSQMTVAEDAGRPFREPKEPVPSFLSQLATFSVSDDNIQVSFEEVALYKAGSGIHEILSPETDQ